MPEPPLAELKKHKLLLSSGKEFEKELSRMSYAALTEGTEVRNANHSRRGTSGEAVWQGSFSRDEMNLAEFPLAVLSTRVDPNIKTLEFSDSQRLPSGEVVERKWIITGADKFGLPTATDDDVVLGLMRLSMAQGFRERKVYFTRYELLKTLRWSTEGRSYQRLIKSLDRLSGVRIRSTNSFYDNQSKSYQTLNFGLIDSYEINDGRRGPNEEEQKSYFVWGEQLFDSFQAGYIKKLDLDLYFSLRSAVSRRLYRYLDKHFYYKSTIERPLLQFAFEKLGLSRSYKYVSSVKQQLEPALEELVNIGFLHSFEFIGKGQATSICFYAAGAGRASPQSARTPSLAPEASTLAPAAHTATGACLISPLTQQLIDRGMAAPQARRLIGQIPRIKHERIEKIISYYDQLVAQNDYKVSKNRVGFLYRAVERCDEFSLPQDQQAPQRARRPELKVFRAKRPNKEDLLARSTANLEQALGQGDSFAKAIALHSAEELQLIYQRVEEKMRCFKSILEESKYREAVEGCVREEVLRRLSK